MIFVTGAARSGTSFITKVLKAHGCHLGEDRWINRLYENVRVRETVLKPYLMQCEADPLGQTKFPDMEALAPCDPVELRERVLGLIGGGEPRAYKDAKLTFVWPVFAEAFPKAKWLLVRRDREQIIESCIRTPFMRLKKRKQWDHWLAEHEKRFVRMRAELDTLEIWPDQVMTDPEAFSLAAKFCCLQFDPEKVRRSIERGAWHRAMEKAA